MKEIIDLAFVIVLMQISGFSGYPLYMDEFGKTFDKTHQSRALDFIRRIGEQYGMQIFMISHFDDARYMASSEFSTIVLDDTNIDYVDNGSVNRNIIMR